MKKEYFFDRVLLMLRGRPSVGGLEVLDSAIRFAYFDGERWQIKVERLAPGILENCEIKNETEFLRSLKALRSQITEFSPPGRRVNVVVTLSSATVYSQVFTLPAIKGDNLEKAVALNLQVVSPSGSGESYAGWQMVGEDKNLGRIEVLSAFASRSVVDAIKQSLQHAEFFPIVVEFKALAISRLLREQSSGFNPLKSYFVLSIDPHGMDLLIIRRGQLYFEYFTSWKDIQGDSREITNDVFQTALIRNLHQLLNFYSQHWSDQMPEVLISAGDLNQEAFRIVKENFSLDARELKLKSNEPLSAEWLVILGSGLRSMMPRQKDQEINFLGAETEREFYHEHLLSFTGFWRVLFPVAMGVLMIAFFITNLFLTKTEASLKSDDRALNLDYNEIGVIEEFEIKVRDFNRAVNLVRSVREGASPEGPFLERIGIALKANGITLNRFEFRGPAAPAAIRGEADSEDQIRSLKNAIESDPIFENVTLPLTDIQRTYEQKLSFSLSFSVNPKNTE